jgi:hypothetical protein
MALKPREAVPIASKGYWLPSAGIPYLDEFPDFPEEIEIGSYTIETEAVLVSNGTAVDKFRYIIGRVAKLPKGFPVEKLIIADEMAIIAIARGQTYGEVYQFSATCPSCGHQSIISCRVPEELPVKRWDRNNRPSMSVTLPVSKDVVVTRMLRIDDEVRTSKWLNSIKSLNPNQPQDTISYIRDKALQIVSVNGGVADTVEEAEEYLRILPGPDMIALQEHLANSACGIRYEYTITCEKCAHVFERVFPIQNDFFRRNRPGWANANIGDARPAPGTPENGGTTGAARESRPVGPVPGTNPAG